MNEKTMTLKERLQAIKSQHKENAATQGSCYDAPPAQPGDIVRAKLKALGEQQLVNPPATTQSAGAPETPWHHVEMDGDKMVAAGGVQALDTEGDACPICGKIFKVLAKHRCKAAQPKPQVDVDALPLNVQENPVAADAPITEVPAHSVEGIEPRFFGYVLLINCVEISKKSREDVVSAIDLCKPVVDAICKERNVEHWKLVEFGGGAALLAARFKRYWETQKFSGLIELNSRSLEYESIRDTLIEFADIAYQGVF